MSNVSDLKDLKFRMILPEDVDGVVTFQAVDYIRCGETFYVRLSVHRNDGVVNVMYDDSPNHYKFTIAEAKNILRPSLSLTAALAAK